MGFDTTVGASSKGSNTTGMSAMSSMSGAEPSLENQTEALAIAMVEVAKIKEEKKEREEQKEEEDDIDADIVLIEATDTGYGVDESKIKRKDKNYTGTSKVIKLPYIIGSYEYNKHPYAGVIYTGEGEVEQNDLHDAEVK